MLSLSARSIPKRSFVSQRAAARFYSRCAHTHALIHEIGEEVITHKTSTVHDNDPDTLEREKQRNLAQKQHLTSTPVSEAPGWNESLATSSEANVKVGRAW